MRLGSLSINDPLLGASNDYAELGKSLPDHFQDIHNTRPPPPFQNRHRQSPLLTAGHLRQVADAMLALFTINPLGQVA